ncbi:MULTISPECIES: DUF7684 family protein [Variovorax]|uniref:DUF7684 domain-containing protein n=1 Tax=Variovorax boronicumulans TaxID=436515 RepID=A0AAW8DXI7_9BURK|nr:MULTISPECIES: hypothetical protein [Variovorax]MDP9879192.1 hypothetical protein [Variovorax boronicumulans]MDP9924476.1 hypothetical protein [Variovorax boronicumulans]TSD61343.1 hypothetical protein FFI97_014225 [Variovorax sp. KBS0712]GER12316.1 hypothetical protein VHAB30_34960 [Variovorax boronicumulans]
MPELPVYFHMQPGATLPNIGYLAPFRAVVIIEEEVSIEWRDDVSNWLVNSGCLYMMAWGLDCTLWDDSVDWANIGQFPFEDIPEDRFVVTTWHDSDPLDEVFYFCKHTAAHPIVELPQAILLHIARNESAGPMLNAYSRA